MFAAARTSGFRLLAFGASAAIAFAACSGNSSTPTPPPTDTPAPATSAAAADTPAATVAPAGGGACDLAAADAAFTNLNSYQFKMTLAGSATDALQDLPIDDADVYTLKGTIVNKPAAAADITIGKFHLIETGGFDYFDADGNGSFTQVGPDQGGGSGGDSGATDTPSAATDTPAPSGGPAGSSLASQFTPEAMFGGNVVAAGADGFTASGTENKNGVAATHCTAGELVLEQLGSTLGVSDATWTGDVWIANDGGYPVSIALVAKAKNGSLAYEILIDLSKVNDAGNKVEAPTNISGA